MTTNNVRRWILRKLALLYAVLEERWCPMPKTLATGGKMLAFIPQGRSLGHDVIGVRSVRGGFGMGTVEWSNQWGRARFKPHSEAIFDQQCLAEIYACMREMK